MTAASVPGPQDRIRIRAQWQRTGGFRLDADLDAPASGVTALFGPSGCGKTSLLRILAGFEQVPGAQVSVAGQVWQDGTAHVFLPPAARRAPVVFQEPRLFPHLNVRRNLEFGLHRVPAGERKVDFDRAVSILGLDDLLDRRVHQLSGGEAQRVAIGRAVLSSPRLLLLDEPLASLDTARKRDLLPFLRRLHLELFVPIFYVTHALGEILQLADQVALMSEGRVVATGPVREVFARADLGGALTAVTEGSILDAVVDSQEPEFGLTKVSCHGHVLEVPQRVAPQGTPIRVHVRADDVTLRTTGPDPGSSALNVLRGSIVQIVPRAADLYSAEAVVDVGGALLRARITRKSAAALHLAPGTVVWAHVKAVTLEEQLFEPGRAE